MEDVEYLASLIKTDTKVFRYDEVARSLGWTHDVYYDREANIFIIDNFPVEGQYFEVPEHALEDGPAEINVGDKTYNVEIRK